MTFVNILTRTAGTWTLDPDDQVVRGDPASGIVTFSLPAVSAGVGQLYSIENVNPGAFPVIVDAAGSDTIAGKGSIRLDSREAVTLVSAPGQDWEIKSSWHMPSEEIHVKDPRFGATGDDSTNDTAAILAAVAALPANGATLVFDSGIYRVSASIIIAIENVHVRFEGGAELRVHSSWAPAATDPLLWLKASRCVVHDPIIRGSAVLGNGIGIQMVGDVSGVHDCAVVNPEIKNCDSGIEFGIVGTASTGDCYVQGGRIFDCKAGIRNRGFTNRAISTRIYRCNENVDCTNDRSSQRFEGWGMTLSQWRQRAINVRGGNGTIFHDTWMEHTDPALTPNEVVRVGGLISLGDTTDREVSALTFSGTTKVTLEGETDIFDLYSCRDLLVEDLTISTNGTPPTNVVKGETELTGTNNRFRRVRLYPGVQGFNSFGGVGYPNVVDNNGTGEIVVEEIFDVENTRAASTIGGGDLPAPDATYTIYRRGTAATKAAGAQAVSAGMTLLVDSIASFDSKGRVMLPGITQSATYTGLQTSPAALLGVTGLTVGTVPDDTAVAQAPTYFAKNRRGHIVVYGGDSYVAPLQSGLKTVLEAIDQGKRGTKWQFVEGRFHFLDAPLGTEVGIAGVLDHATVKESWGLEIAGLSTESTIISNRTGFDPLRAPNYTLPDGTGPDTEPLSFTKCPRLHLHDFTVEGCGVWRSTTDAIDCDQSTDAVIERVLVKRSRSRGIKVDDGNPGSWGGGNDVEDCVVQGCPDEPEIDGRPGGSLVLGREYRYCATWVDVDSNAPNKQMETRPSDPRKYVPYTDVYNYQTARVFLPFGPYSCAARKIYRWDDSTTTWKLLATVTDPTATQYDDDGTVDLSGVSAAVFTRHSVIPQSGIEYLSTKEGGIVEGNRVFGTGDGGTGVGAGTDASAGPNGEPAIASGLFGASQHGINITRKATYSHTNQPTNHVRVLANRVRGITGYGIRFGGANYCIALANDVSNTGYRNVAGDVLDTSTRRSAIRVENVADAGTGATTSDTILIDDNICYDDREATHPNGLTGMSFGIQVSDTNGLPTNVKLGINAIKGAITAEYDVPTSVEIPLRSLRKTIAWNPGSIAAYAGAGTTIADGFSTDGISVPGAAVGDQVIVGYSSTTLVTVKGGLILYALVTAVDTVTVYLFNATASAKDPANGTLTIDVLKR